ncbi:MAG: hypothetical protein HQK61_08620 [Desulfamplus sp.]|nr:hypothetical protein [Desulfamplus sp.]
MSGSLYGFNSRGFDLRRKSDRKFLEATRTRLCSVEYCNKTYDNCVADSGLRPESIIISNVLDGYDQVKDFVQTDSCDADSCPVEFAEGHFMEHKRFTGVGCNAFFVKDVLLEVPAPTAFNADNNSSSLIDMMVEIADCQGSDSIDPSHMAHIQDYLLSANILVYIISSRTGLREADFKFLNIIQKMGILNNIFFVVNADLSEHESLESLMELEKSVKQALGYLVQSPVVYTLSSLFNLFSALVCPENKNHVSDKDLARLYQWQQETDLVEYTGKKHIELQLALKNRIETGQFAIMLENHIERLRIVIQGAQQRNAMFMELLSGDLDKISDAAEKLKQLQVHSRRFESLVDDSIQNTVDVIKRNIVSAIKIFFDKKRGIQAISIKNFISGSAIYNDRYQEMVAVAGFNHALYCMFQDFRTELDLFMSHQFNAAVIKLINDQEEHIEKEFHSLYQSCYMAPSKIYQQPEGVACHQPEAGVPGRQSDEAVSLQEHMPRKAVDLDGARRILGLALPGSSFATSYSAKIRFDAMARFSFYSMMRLLGKLMSSLVPEDPESRALRESARQIRKESLRSVMLHFDEYRHHLQSEYFFPLVQAVARDLREKLIEMSRMCEVESGYIETLISNEQTDKSDKLEHVKNIASATHEIADRINEIYIKAIS